MFSLNGLLMGCGMRDWRVVELVQGDCLAMVDGQYSMFSLMEGHLRKNRRVKFERTIMFLICQILVVLVLLLSSY